MNTSFKYIEKEIVQFTYRNILMWIILEELSLYYITNINKNVYFNKPCKQFKNIVQLLEYCKFKFKSSYDEIERKILEII